MRRSLVAVLVLAIAAVVLQAAFAGGQHVTLTLDWTPNPDHVGFYYARDTGLFERAGLDVAIHGFSFPWGAMPSSTTPTMRSRAFAAGQS